jgi:hypothetical protein
MLLICATLACVHIMIHIQGLFFVPLCFGYSSLQGRPREADHVQGVA